MKHDPIKIEQPKQNFKISFLTGGHVKNWFLKFLWMIFMSYKPSF